MSGAVDLGQWLIENGADLDVQDEPDGATALMRAIWNGHDTLAVALIDAGADPNARTRWKNNSETPLEAAVNKGNVALAIRLLDAGASLNPDRLEYGPVLSLALTSPAMLERLLNSGLDLNQKDIFGRYPLSIVMDEGPSVALEMMVEAGTESYLKDWRGPQPFLRFAKRGMADLVRLCLEKSAIIRQDSALRKDALFLAMRSGRTDVVRVLLEREPFYTRMESVDAVLKNSKPPPDDPDAIRDIRALFERRLKPRP